VRTMTSAEKLEKAREDNDAGEWAIYFEDASRGPELYTSRKSAHERFEKLKQGWNVRLFERIDLISTPSDPLPSDRDMALSITAECVPMVDQDGVYENMDCDMHEITRLITAHREAAVKEWQEKLRSLLSGLEAENIGYMLEFFSGRRFENYGAAYVQVVKARVSEAEKKAREEEREKSVNYSVCWMIANRNTETMDNTDVSGCVKEILENMQGDGK
jgi:hypothetical protein